MTTIEQAAREYIAANASQHLDRDADMLSARCAAHLRERFGELSDDTAREVAAFAVDAWRAAK